jgi:cyclophilin family peptidyl-prolyl cis-trans isomerase
MVLNIHCKHTRKPACAQGCYNKDKLYLGEISMTSKKKHNKSIEAKKTEKTIQYVAVAMIIVVVVIIIAPYVSKLFSKPSESSIANSSDIGNGTACESFNSIPAAQQYNTAPAMLVDQAKQYFATFKLAKGGEFVVELYPSKAPITVNSFVFLACKNYFDGVTFHRVLEGFMAQGGDPTGTGTGGPGYEFVNENSDLTFNKAGVMAMANAGPDTNGSQFFITFGPTEQLNGGYTIFGQVLSGMDVVNGITRRDPQQSPAFEGDKIEAILITEK